MTIEELQNLVQDVKKQNKIILSGYDFDSTISDDHYNPFENVLDNDCAVALKRLYKSGVKLVVISNRPGRFINETFKRHGIEELDGRYTYGYEKLHMENGQYFVQIDERFGKYTKHITSVLRDVLINFVPDFSLPPDPTAAEHILHIKGEPVYLETKGRGAEGYPFGFAQVWNFNDVSPQQRGDLVFHFKQVYTEAIEKLNDHELEKVWGMTFSGEAPDKPGRFSIGLEPVLKEGKAYGMKKILESFENLGLVMFAGDHNQDSYAMQVAYDLEKESQGKVKGIGIYVKDDLSQTDVQKIASIQVDGVKEHAVLMNKLADVLEEL
jgi:trehalose-6-phosphatase